MGDLPYSHIVRLAEVPPNGTIVHLSPDRPTLAALARHVDLVALHSLDAQISLAHEREGARVEGHLKASVRQISVVSLEPFDSELNERFEVHFVPEDQAVQAVAEEDIDPETDPPDVLVDGAIDIGALVTEFLSLAIDPYPRRDGEVFEPPADEAAAAISPFAALARLKDGS